MRTPLLCLIILICSSPIWGDSVDNWWACWRESYSENNAAEMEVLMAKDGAPLSNKNWNELFWAVWTGDLEKVKRLDKDGIGLRSKDDNGMSILHWAVLRGYITLLDWLLERDIELINAQDNIGQTALHVAAGLGNIEIVVLLLAAGIELNARDNGGHTALHAAVHAGHREVVALLLDRGIEPDIRDNNGLTALHLAVVGDNLEVVKLLLWAKDIDINIQDTNWRAPLHHAARAGKLEAVQLFWDRCVELNAQDMESWEASYNPEAVSARSIKLNVEDAAGQTALHHAAARGHKEVVNLLLKEGLDINAKDNAGYTPFMRLIDNGFTIEECLNITPQYQKNGILFSFTEFPMKPVEYINWYSDDLLRDEPLEYYLEAFLEYIKKFPLNPELQNLLYATNQARDTPFRAAARAGQLKLVRQFLEFGLDPNSNENPRRVYKCLDLRKKFQNTDFYLPLHAAAQIGAVEVLELLIEYGADINRQDAQGRTALHIAIERGNWQAVEFLLENNARVDLHNFYPGIQWAPGGLEGPTEHENALHTFVRKVIKEVQSEYEEVQWNNIYTIFRSLLMEVSPGALYIENYDGHSALDVLLNFLSVRDVYSENLLPVVNALIIRLLQVEIGLKLSITEDANDIINQIFQLILAYAEPNRPGRIVEILMQTDCEEALKKLLGQDYIIVEDLRDYRPIDGSGNTLLHYAVEAKNIKVVRYLLETLKNIQSEKTSLEQTNRNELSILELLFRVSPLDFIGELFESETLNEQYLIHYRDKHGNSLLHHAVLGNNTEVIEGLMDIDSEEISPEMLQNWINQENNDKHTPLHLAAMRNLREAAEFLLDRNADINTQDMAGNTPLHICVLQDYRNYESLALIDLLLHNAADITIINNEGNCPAHIAVARGYRAALLRILKQANQHQQLDRVINDKDLRDAHKNTLLNLAILSAPVAQEGRYGTYAFIIQDLLSRGANPNILNADGNAALHLAVARGRVDNILKALVAYKNAIDKDLCNAQNRTGMQIAESQGAPELLNYLLEHNLQDAHYEDRLMISRILNGYIEEYLNVLNHRSPHSESKQDFQERLKAFLDQEIGYQPNQPTGRVFNVPGIGQLEERYMNGENLECGFLGLGLNGRQEAAEALLEGGDQNNAQGTEVRALMADTIYDVLVGDPREWPQELREAMTQPNVPHFRDILNETFRLGEGHLFGQLDDHGHVRHYLQDNRTESPLWRWITNPRVFEAFIRGHFVRPTTMLTFYGYDGQGARMHGMLDALARARKVQVVIWQGDETRGLEEIYRTAQPETEGFEVIHLRFIGNEGIGHFNRLILRNEAQAAPAAVARNSGQRTACPTPTPWPTPQPSMAIMHENASNQTEVAGRQGLLMLNGQLLNNGAVCSSYDK